MSAASQVPCVLYHSPLSQPPCTYPSASTARVPLDGFDPPLNITQGDADMALNSLPRAHTCFNQLVLPRYSNFGMLYKQLKFAAENTVGFELA